jgi:hypothetical protein
MAAGLLPTVMAISIGLQFWYASRVTPRLPATTHDASFAFPEERMAHLLPIAVRNSSLSLANAASLSLSSFSSNLTIDILSIGSLSRPENLQAQRETMGRYVRSFTGVTEADDHSEPHCSLSRQDAQAIAERCKIPRDKKGSDPPSLDQPYSVLYLRRQVYAQWTGFLSKRENPGGWLCAQKRANDGLQIVLRRLRQPSATLPDYLLLIDDDTFIDIPQLTYYLQTIHPDSSKPLVMAGCLIRFRESFSIPFGGFGTFLSKGALMRLFTPISCANVTALAPSDDGFIQNACYRLQQNLFGERQYFQEGMSLTEFMHAYVSTHRFADHASWTKESSYCVHSDWVWGYFFNYYNVGDALNHPKHPESYNKMTSYRLSEQYAMKWGLNIQQRMAIEGQCRYTKTCPPEAHMCHYVTAKQIREGGQRVFEEPKWVTHDSQQPIPIFLYPFLNHTIEHELKHFLYDGIQQSSRLTLTKDHANAPVWIVDVRRAGFSSKNFCNRFVQLARSVNGQKRIVILVYWDDEPIDHFWDCYRATRVLDSTTVYRYKRSIVKGRQWNETLQFTEPGSIIAFGNWRDHSGGPVRHIGYGVRSDTVDGVESILNGASIWEIERSVDVSHFWPLPGKGDKEVLRGKASQLRDAVSSAIYDKLSQIHEVFVGVTGQAQETGRNTAQSAYLHKLLQSKIVVVSQKDNWEDHYRLMEALVSGAMVMTDSMLTLPNKLQENISIVIYHSLDELVAKAQYYLDHEDERVAVAKAGYDIAMNYHRSWHLVERMVSEVRGVAFE